MITATIALATTECNDVVKESINSILGEAYLEIAQVNIRQSARLGHHITEMTIPRRVSEKVISGLENSGFLVEKQKKAYCRYTIRW